MGGKSSQSTQQIQIPPEVLARYNAVNARAESVAERPYQQYSTDPSAFVAPLTPTQQAGIANTNYYANTAQPYYQAATGLTMAGAQAVNPGELGAQQINQYMSPYLGNVLQGTAALQNQLNQQAMAGQTGNAIRQGAFGGDRAGIAAANLAQQQQLASSKTFSDILNQGYNQALGTAQQQQALGLSAAQANRAALQGVGSQIANLGLGAQSAGLQGAQAQLAAGQAGQQTEQAGKTALYNQFLQGQSYPFQVAQFLANIAMGTGALSGSTTQTNQAMGGFSDKRLKENIKPVGKTFDGQTIYSYNFKGEPQTEIGLIAQEVEKHHPEAVGLAGGYKTVRYDKATDNAAERGHFASGGSAMGGGVMPMNAGQGYYDGGSVGFDPGLMQQILSTYERMYAPLEGQKGGLGAASYVPESNIPVGQIMAPGALPDMPNPSAGMQGMVDLGTGVGGLGGNLGLWDYTDEQRKETRRREAAKKAEDQANDQPEALAYGGLAAARHAYATDGSVNADDEIVVEGRREQKPEPEIRKVEVPVEKPAPVQIAPVSKPATNISQKPDFKPMGLNIPQVGNTVGLAVAPGLDSLKDSTGDILQGIGKVASAAAAFSDRRLKENVRAVGKTFDGQTVYSYNYKGEPQTRMGLIAQDVEKHHPHAVGSREGYKTVNYKQATGVAARRGHFAEGGDVGENDNQPAGIDIPMVNNATGLAGAPGLSSLQNNLGDVLSGVGSMAEAGKDIFDKADGGALSGLGALEFKHEGLEPDFGLEPEDLASSGDEDFEYLMRGRGLGDREEEPKPSGLAAFEQSAEEFQNSYKPKKTGLAPTRQQRPEAALPSDLSTIAKLIRGHEGTGKNPLSSAVAPYQMIDDTFVQQFRKMYPQRAAGMSRNDILSIRRTPEGTALAERMGPALIQENAAFLSQRGHAPNARNVYLAHFFGPQGALKVLSANPSTPIEQIVGQDVVRANPFLRGKNASGALQFAEQAMAKQQRRLMAPGKAGGGGLAGSTLEDEFDSAFGGNSKAGLAAAVEQPPENVDNNEIVVQAEKPKPKLPELKLEEPEFGGVRPTSFGRGKEQKPVTYEGGNIPSYSYDYMTEPFFKGLKKGSAQSWIPLLTGLGTFATMPTRSMLSGLLGGVGAGAQTYANLANERNKQLPTRQAAMAQYSTAMRGFIDKDFQPLGGGRWYYVPTGEVLNQDQYFKMRAKLQSPSEIGPMMVPQGTGERYDASADKRFRAPEVVRVDPKARYDTSTAAGIFAAAYNDPTVVEARNRKVAANTLVEDYRRQLTDPQIMSSPTAVEAARSGITTANAQLTAANTDYQNVIEKLTGVPMQALSETQRAAVENTMEKASRLEAEKEGMRPIMQQFAALKGDFAGGTAQGAWARVADFLANFGNLTDEQKKLIAGGADANSRQAIMSLVGGPIFDPNMPGDALKWVYENYVTPRYQDLQAQIKSIQPFTAPTSAPQSSVGVTPAITPPPATPPARGQGARVQQGRDGIWRGMSEEAIQADNRIKPGERYRIPDGKGGMIEGVK